MILVTGGTGFVGRRLVESLAAAHTPVRVLTRDPARARLPVGVVGAAGDLLDAASLCRALAGVETVVHLAGKLAGAPPEIEHLNVAGTRALALAAREAGVPRFIHASSAGVYGDGETETPHVEGGPTRPGDAYERSKLAGEAALLSALDGSGIGWAVIRPAGVYGPRRPATAAFFREVARRRLWLHGPARVIVHPTHVDDVVAAIALILARSDVAGETFNVGGERALDYAELIALVGERMGRRPRQLHAPWWLAAGAATASGVSRAVLGRAPARLARWGRPIVNRALDTAKARRVLGFAPIPLARGLEETAAALRAEAAAAAAAL